MKGIENISRSILEEAQAKAEEILQQARQQGEKLKEKSLRQAGEQREQMEKDAQARAEEVLRHSERTALLENKKAQLAARRDRIGKAYALALEKLLALDDESYCSLLVKLCIETGAREGEILLNDRDFQRCGSHLVKQVNEKTGAALVLSEEKAAISGGFVLRQGAVEMNCALETMVRLLEEETATQVAAILF